MRDTTQHKISNALFNKSNAGVRAVPGVSRVDGGVARQQQLDDFNVTILGGAMQGSGIAEGTGYQEQISEAQYNELSSNACQTTMQV